MLHPCRATEDEPKRKLLTVVTVVLLKICAYQTIHISRSIQHNFRDEISALAHFRGLVRIDGIGKASFANCFPFLMKQEERYSCIFPGSSVKTELVLSDESGHYP